ncbi:zinc finger protein 219-like [Thrips palmi]|uniref:Zinc finger protein 219-like n=1 Tax=Thrips palmi TaxID=161013 RepID=A0A6P8ZWG1_THRPL|nr:zinc finger protein 219-like [Thrips palmi]
MRAVAMEALAADALDPLDELQWQPYTRGVLEQFKGDDGTFGCPRCYKRYQLKKTLSAHLRFECGRAPRFQCPFCAYRSKRNDRLVQHVNTHHPGQAGPAGPAKVAPPLSCKQ